MSFYSHKTVKGSKNKSINSSNNTKEFYLRQLPEKRLPALITVLQTDLHELERNSLAAAPDNRPREEPLRRSFHRTGRNLQGALFYVFAFVLLCQRRGSAFIESRESQFPGPQWMSFRVWVELKGLGLRLRRRARGSECTSQEGPRPWRGEGHTWVEGRRGNSFWLASMLSPNTKLSFLGIGLGGREEVSNLLSKWFRKNNMHIHRQSKMLTISESRWRALWNSLYHSCNFCNFI